MDFLLRILELEEEMEEISPRVRTIRDRSNPFEDYEEQAFKARFRFEKQTVRFILSEIGDFLIKDARGSPLTPAQQLFVALRCYAMGAFNKVVGETMNVHETTVCRAVSNVTTAICRRRNVHIHFPIGEELQIVKNNFYHISGDVFPDIAGCIDGTHIKIACPSVDQAAAYKNSNGFYSINCQVVCDGTFLIRNIVSRWPGSTHDSRVFHSSKIRKRFEDGEIAGHLLGDNGYPCKQYLLTPLKNPSNLSEEQFNSAHKRVCKTIETTIGLWKRRFHCLLFGLRTRVQTSANIIVATAVLHNIAIRRRDEMVQEDIELVEVPVSDVEENDTNGDSWRSTFIQNHFVNKTSDSQIIKSER